MHETQRNGTRTGTASLSCHCLVEGRPWHLRSGPDGGCSQWLRREMARCLQASRPASPEKQAATGSATKAFPGRTSTVDPSAEEEAGGSWLSHCSLDTVASGRGDPQELLCSLPSFTGLANLDRPGLDLPKARTTGERTRRTSHRKLAKERLAAHKKTRVRPGVASFFPTKAASCSSLWFVVLGPHAARHRSCTVGTGMTKRHRLGLYFDLSDHNVRTDDFEGFVRGLLSHLPHGFILVMDRWPVHRSGAGRFRRLFPRRVRIEWLPPYAPDLNPTEQVWNRSKYTDLANFVPDDVGSLRREVRKSMCHMCSEQSLLRSFFHKAGLKL
jgi:transposase